MGSNQKQIKKILINNGSTLTVEELKEELNIYDDAELFLSMEKVVSKGIEDVYRNPSKYNYLCCAIRYIAEIISTNPKLISLETYHQITKIKNNIEQKQSIEGLPHNLRKFYTKMLDLVDPMEQILDRKTKREQKKEYEQISNTNLYKFTSKLIFNVKNFYFLSQMAKIYPELINCTDEKGRHIIYEVIKKQFSNIKKKKGIDRINYYSRIINYIINCNEFYLTEKQLRTILNYLRTNLCNLESMDSDNIELINYVRELLDNLKCKNRMHTIPQNVRDLCKKYGIYELDDDYMLDNVKVNTSKKIVDYTNKLIISMDTSNNVRIFDDAISLEILPNGNYLVGIYIADVASLVPYKSDLDSLAYNRAESIYLNDRVIDMLPRDLSFKCSLNRSGTKKALAYMFEFTKDIELCSFKVEHAIINVNSNLTFKAGQRLYLNKSEDAIGTLIRNLIDFNMKFDASQFYTYNLNYHKFKEEIRKMENVHEHHGDHNDCTHLVANLMILVNRTMAEYFFNKNYPFLYRVNNSDIDDELIEQIKSAPDYKNLPLKLTEQIEKVYSKSSYSSNTTAHNGLKLDHYCHTTNPIRNYASLFTQRMIIDEFINGGIPDKILREYEDGLPMIASYLNTTSDKYANFKHAYNQIQKKFTRK